MSDLKKKEMEIRDKAILHQQRRLKQATQFIHKDSADLLPLDGLKRLGTSKDLQPHNIVQRRLLESNITKLHGDPRDIKSMSQSPLAEEIKSSVSKDTACSQQWATLGVYCKCCDQEIKVIINTGCQQNTISTSCLNRIGLKELPAAESDDCGDNRFTRSTNTMERVEKLEIILGKEKVQCSALVVDNKTCELSLGLQTLLSLKCVIDLERGALLLGKSETQIPFITESGQDEEEENDEEEEKE
ncbi:nuclear receptor-interacting protein 3-like [Scyliorhinus canicula]|uniref:nuclear receptor-interacting protein 3-like n=1 Tax=Scyliorhinus canicula TaxID=7830 RepID=UPI0018F5D844|nr:nuclear receptor-interacting protein 3-like [Scyliorhinus canicula]